MSRIEIEQQIATLTAQRDVIARGIDWSLNERGHGVSVASGGEAIPSLAVLNQRIANLRRKVTG